MGLDARGLMDGLQVGRLVDVLLLCGVIAVAPPPLGTQPPLVTQGLISHCVLALVVLCYSCGQTKWWSCDLPHVFTDVLVRLRYKKMTFSSF